MSDEDLDYQKNDAEPVALHLHTSKTVDNVINQFLRLLRRSKISKKEAESFLRFINGVLPIPHNMPTNMNQLLKQINIKDYFRRRSVCILCGKDLQDNARKCDTCSMAESKHVGYILDTYFPSLLNVVVGRAASDIDKYKRLILSPNEHTPYDIPFGRNYQYLLNKFPGQDLLSLILHIDGISLTKSSNLSLWVCNASIVELPPKLRTERKNIILCSLYIGREAPDPKVWLNSFCQAVNAAKKEGKMSNETVPDE